MDVARLMSAGTQRTSDEKEEFMAQMDTWAENFADKKLEQDKV